MKAVSIIVGALAAFATAAPTKEVETRGNFDLGLLNNLNSFNNQNIQYLGVLNGLNLGLLSQLGQVNNFNVLAFQGLFQNNVFDLNSILQLQQLQLLLQFGQLGVFNGFDLSSLVLSNVNLGLINGIGSFGFDSLIDQSLIPGISSVASQRFGGVASPLGVAPPSVGVAPSPVANQPGNGQAVQPAGAAAPAPGSVVTAEQFNAQEGGASLPE